jgi:O-antigen biosynthesis protein WbqP
MSNRVGINNTIFKMPKFRTMKVDTPVLPTHLLSSPSLYINKFGFFLRKTSLDELPQLWSILLGHMSFVGPRPALFNQIDLIELRTKYGVHQLVPGLTGWAQVNGRDELPIFLKVQYDIDYLNRKSFLFDLKILVLTILRVFQQKGIAH